MFRIPTKNKFFQLGFTTFLTVIAILTVYDVFFGSHQTVVYFKFLGAVITPVVYGGAIAYLLAPVVDFWEHTILRRWAEPGFQTRKPVIWVRVTSVLMTLVLVLLALGVLFWVLIPDVAASMMQLVENLPVYIDLVQQLINTVEGAVTLPDSVLEKIAELYGQGVAIVNQVTTVGVPEVISGISGGLMGFVRFVGNLILGLVVACYMIGMKETLTAQGKKFICAIFNEEYTGRIMKALRYTDDIFGNFIRGDLLDALIVGVVSFVFLNLTGMPYAPLLSILIGLTNLIPFFGPFLGAIPSCVLIFLVDPIQCLEFIIFVLILQQIDGNVLKPKILGQTMGLASLWVIISILIGGGLFGPVGMLLGCPAFALLYALCRLVLSKGLAQKDMPVDTDSYRTLGIPNKLDEKMQKE